MTYESNFHLRDLPGDIDLLANGFAEQDFYYALGGVSIPIARDAAFFGFAGEDGPGSGKNFRGVLADELVGALGDGDGALGIFAHGEAGDAEGGGFFLDAAGIGEHQAGAAHETEKIEIAERGHETDAIEGVGGHGAHAFLGARMDGKDYL